MGLASSYINVLKYVEVFWLLLLLAGLNHLDSKGNYRATSNNTKLVHWPLMVGLLHLVRRGEAWTGCGPTQSPPRCTKCNSPPINGQCTNHSILLYNGLLGSNVPVKGLRAGYARWLPVDVDPLSIRRPSRGHRPIAKTKQDRSITVKHY